MLEVCAQLVSSVLFHVTQKMVWDYWHQIYYQHLIFVAKLQFYKVDTMDFYHENDCYVDIYL
jgi:hypothetical protein